MLITRMTKVVVVVSAPTFSDVQLSLHHKIRAPSGHSVFPQKWSEQRVRNSSQSYYGSNGSIVPWCGLYVPGILIIVICLFDRFFFCREWFLNGNILIIIVSIFIILPLAIMKQLGMFSILSSHFFFLHTVCFVAFCQVHFHVLFFFLFLFFIIHCHWFYCWFRHLFFHCPPGYLGYTSGFSLSCMVFFLISVSQTEHTNKLIIVNCNQPYP